MILPGSRLSFPNASKLRLKFNGGGTFSDKEKLSTGFIFRYNRTTFPRAQKIIKKEREKNNLLKYIARQEVVANCTNMQLI